MCISLCWDQQIFVNAGNFFFFTWEDDRICGTALLIQKVNSVIVIPAYRLKLSKIIEQKNNIVHWIEVQCLLLINHWVGGSVLSRLRYAGSELKPSQTRQKDKHQRMPRHSTSRRLKATCVQVELMEPHPLSHPHKHKHDVFSLI